MAMMIGSHVIRKQQLRRTETGSAASIWALVLVKEPHSASKLPRKTQSALLAPRMQ